jgi:hypothetical protein
VLNIWLGTAITIGDTRVSSTALSQITAQANIGSNRIYINADGSFGQAAVTPMPSNAIPIATVSCDASNVTSLYNDNITIGRAIDTYSMVLRYSGPLAVGTDLDWSCLPFAESRSASGNNLEEWYLERVYVTFGLAGSGAGSTIIDINRRERNVGFLSAGVTIYTSQGTFDRRPTITTSISARDPDNPLTTPPFGNSSHEVRVFSGGDRFSFDVDAVTATPPTDVEIQLQFRRLR